MPVPLVQQIQEGAADLANELATIAAELGQVNGAVADVNRKPVPGTGTPGTQPGILDQVKGALSDVNKAAQLKDLLPVVIAVVGILTGRAVLGIILAVLVYYYGQPKPAPAAR